jgi:nicotinamidase-related amidase
MTVTALDPKTALIVIDLQKGLVSLPTIHPIEGVATHVGTMAAAFREQGLPVVLVNVAGAPAVRTEQPRRNHVFPEGWTNLIPELNQQPEDHVVTKYTPGAFTKTGLEAYLQARGVTQIVMTGIATSNGVEVTARQAYELGFNIAFPIDAMTDIAAEAHNYSVTRVFPKIGETGTAEEIIAILKRSTRS